MSNFSSISNLGLELIKKFESFSPVSYVCPAGKTTIGYGHVILPGEKFTSLTEKKAEELLIKDLMVAIHSVNDLVTSDINHNQFSTLVSLVFNIGKAAFAASTLVKIVNSKNHLEVPAELVKWKMAAGSPLKGLLMRRLAEAILYLS